MFEELNMCVVGMADRKGVTLQKGKQGAEHAKGGNILNAFQKAEWELSGRAGVSPSTSESLSQRTTYTNYMLKNTFLS